MYIRLSDSFYPLTEQDIRNAFPNVSFPTPFAAEGYAVVFPTPAPAVDWYHAAREIAPVLTSKGTWAQAWEVVDVPRTPEEEAERLAQAKAAKSAEILTGSDAAMNAITSSYSANEKLSWPKQEAEAKVLLADPNAPAPLLRGIADTRGIALTVLRDKVLANVEASEALTALILGTQQKYEDAVKAATTVEEVQAIEVKYGGI